MEMKTLIHFFILLFVAHSPCLIASSVSTPASSAALVLTAGLDAYQKEHGGRLPREWSELDGKYVKMRIVEEKLKGKIDEQFLLIDDSNIQMVSTNQNETFNGGTIVAVIASPVNEDRRQTVGRYVIWREDGGRFRLSWLDESAVLAQFEKAGVQLPTGPLKVQPSTLDASPDYILQKYAEENFKDPTAPTAEELETMKQVFLKKYSDKPAATPRPTVPLPQSTLPPSTSKTVASPNPAATTETKQSPSSFSIVPLTILAAVIVGVVVFLLRRKGP